MIESHYEKSFGPIIHKAERLTFPVPLPYDLSERAPTIEPEPYDLEVDWQNELEWLQFNAEESEIARIFTAAVVLYHHKKGTVTMSKALHSAIIWERG